MKLNYVMNVVRVKIFKIQFVYLSIIKKIRDMTNTMNIDLVALTSERGDSCYHEHNGEKIYDFRRVTITVNNADGSSKKYLIVRSTAVHSRYKHYIETYTIPADATWYDSQRNKRWKWYDDSNFDTKLKKLAREIAKTDHAIRNW